MSIVNSFDQLAQLLEEKKKAEKKARKESTNRILFQNILSIRDNSPKKSEEEKRIHREELRKAKADYRKTLEKREEFLIDQHKSNPEKPSKPIPTYYSHSNTKYSFVEDIQDTAIVEKIVSILSSSEPDEFEILTLLSEYYGNKYESQMSITKWIDYIHTTDWKSLGSPNGVYELHEDYDDFNKSNHLNEYKKKFASLHTAIVKGKKAPHKALLLMAIMDAAADQCYECEPVIMLDEELIGYFKNCVSRFKIEGNIPNICMPFFHLKKESFWHPNYNTGYNESSLPTSYTTCAINKIMSSVTIDKELWILIRDENTRNDLKDILIQNYINQG